MSKKHVRKGRYDNEPCRCYIRPACRGGGVRKYVQGFNSATKNGHHCHERMNRNHDTRNGLYDNVGLRYNGLCHACVYLRDSVCACAVSLLIAIFVVWAVINCILGVDHCRTGDTHTQKHTRARMHILRAVYVPASVVEIAMHAKSPHNNLPIFPIVGYQLGLIKLLS